jgi:hypothetical protein
MKPSGSIFGPAPVELASITGRQEQPRSVCLAELLEQHVGLRPGKCEPLALLNWNGMVAYTNDMKGEARRHTLG